MGLNNQFMIVFINPDFCKSLLSFTSAAQISKETKDSEEIVVLQNTHVHTDTAKMVCNTWIT